MNTCSTDDDCAAGWICTDEALCIEDEVGCDELSAYLEFLWSDFEDEELTNVEGFRVPINDRTRATNLEGMGLNEGTIVQLDYELEDSEDATGYRLFAYPNADVSDFTHLVIRLRADEERTIGIEMRDVETIYDESHFYHFDVPRQWREVIIAIDDFERIDEETPGLDTSVLQLIKFHIEGDQGPPTGTIYVDHVGFVEYPDFQDEPFVWSDFENEELTNVEGFREPINEATEASDLPGEGQDDGTVVQLDFEMGDEDTTGYRLFAFPNADVSEYTHLVMRLRARQEIFNATLEFFDDRDEQGVAATNIPIYPEWHEVIVALDQLTVPDDETSPPDFSSLQWIDLLFDDALVCPNTGTVDIDWVRFRRRP